MSDVFHRPQDAYLADVIPFYWQGEYHLFYLKDWRNPAEHGEGTPWYHLVTRDFVTFEDLGEAIPRGSSQEQDLYIFTGCVYRHDNLFHIFYTGHNPHRLASGRPSQAVMHATSPDLRHWTKDTSLTLLAPTGQGYEPNDWRDPFVYFDERLGEHAMLLAARKNVGPKRNRGVVAFLTSPDLIHWKVREPFWAPDAYFTHECPDLFRLGQWWYLVYSTFSERFVTHYRMARTLDGPWLPPPHNADDDVFDERLFYAAKTAGPEQAGSPRYVFGWLPTRDGDKDDGRRNWGGELVVHQIAQRPDGSLRVQPPATVLERFTRTQPLHPQPVLGDWTCDNDTHHTRAVGRHSVLLLGDLPHTAKLQTRVMFEQGTVAMGVLLRADAALDKYHLIRIEPGPQRLVADRWPRPGDQPFTLLRSLPVRPGVPVELTLLIDGSCLVVYANDQIALSTRMYDPQQGSLGLFVTEGTARFEGTRLSVMD